LQLVFHPVERGLVLSTEATSTNVPKVTEDTVNDLMASFLRESGLNVTTQVSAQTTGTTRRRTKPDFELRDGAVLYGEGEWDSKYIDGFYQAIEFGDIGGASGYFLIGYPETLRKTIRQRRIGEISPASLLGGIEYRGMLKIKGQKTSLFRGPLEELPEWLKAAVYRKPKPPDANEFVQLMRDIVQDLTNLLPAHGEFPSLFEHIIATMPRDKGELETARRAAAFLLLNQLVFYRILEQRGYPTLTAETLLHPADLKDYFFDAVLKDDYQAVFDFDVASLFPQEAIEYVRDMVTLISVLEPEQFTRDLLGNMFHMLIPLDVRKPVAAYYTNPMAGRLLAKLSIQSSADTVADFACGSGTLLMSAYDRKVELLGRPLDEGTHRKFIEEDLTGIDIMPFAAHLAVVQLALRNPGYLTDKVRVAVYDSTLLRPGTAIRSLQKVMPRGQASIRDFVDGKDENRKVREGAVSSAGAGKGFDVHPVDVVIMNPPFTRKQHVKKDFRGMLTDRFDDYKGFTSKEQNLFGYFVLLADRFVAEDGRVAMVLPATVLQQLSSAGIRRLLGSRYTVDFIVQSGYRSAFSESTAFREILLVATKRKGDGPERACVLATLGEMVTPTNADAISNLLKTAAGAGQVSRSLEENATSLGIRLGVAPQQKLRDTLDWHRLLPAYEVEQFTLPASPALAPLKDVAKRVVQGIRFHEGSDRVDVRNTVISRQRAVDVIVNWRVDLEADDFVEARSVRTGAHVRIPRTALRPTTRSIAGMDTMQTAEAPDYIVVARFPGDDAFWDAQNPDAILRLRLPHLESREAYLVAAGRNNVDLAAPGTHFLAVVSPVLIPPTWSFWSIKTDSLEDAQLLALWWNSTFHLAQLMENRTEVRGSWMGWLRDTLHRLLVLNPKALSLEVRRDLLETYETWKSVRFPPLLDQLKNHFEGRLAIDRAVAKALGSSAEGFGIPGLYDRLASRLEALRDLMGRD
jgi:hypothetical protein